MPKKPNRTDLQNYVPAGNGDESGEYRGGTSTSEGTHDSDWENYRKVLQTKKEALGKAFNQASKQEEKAVEELDRKLPKVDFTPAGDIDQATEYTKSLGIKHVDWGDMSLEAVNTINKRVAQWFKAYPEIRDNMDYIGAYQNINKTIVDTFEHELRVLFTGNDPSDDSWSDDSWDDDAFGGDLVEEYLLRLRQKNGISHNAYAGSFTGATIRGLADNTKMSGIGFNETLFDLSAYQDTRAKMKVGEILGGHPKGAGDLIGTIDHEMGHRLDSIYNASGKSEVISQYEKQFAKAPQEKLSLYAETNAKEFVAEAVSQLYGTGEAGQYAMKIREVIENARKERNK